MSSQLMLMQGRLSTPTSKRIQEFPRKTWKAEFQKIEFLNLDGIEWTIDLEAFEEHPLINPKLVSDPFLEGLKPEKIVTCDFFMQLNFFQNPEGRFEQAYLYFSQLIQSKYLGASSIIVVPLVDNGAPNSKRDWRVLKELLLALSSSLSVRKMKLAFEFEINPIEQMGFLEKLDPELFGINFDMGNSASLGWEPKLEIESICSRLMHIHIKDRPLGGSTVPLGQGDVNFVEIRRVLNRIDYFGAMTLQCARGKPGKEIETIRNYIQYLTDVGFLT